MRCIAIEDERRAVGELVERRGDRVTVSDGLVEGVLQAKQVYVVGETWLVLNAEQVCAVSIVEISPSGKYICLSDVWCFFDKVSFLERLP